ncbi:MAG: hypothetical protein JKY96_05900 [Phycisphaerales bacterium]|nr:hypothetical protein [Phycisphaerales bacterium]
MSTADPTPPEVRGIPEMPAQVVQHLAKPNDPIVGKVIETRICSPSNKAAAFVRHISIDVSGTVLENGWIAGQSFGVIAPGVTDKGKGHKLRLCSISAPTKGEDGNGSIISTTTKRVLDEHWDTHELFTGVCSNYLCDLKVGDEVLLTGPAGKRFVLPADPYKHDFLFIATGTGIAPFRSMLIDLIALGMPCKATLIMGAPYATDLLYHEDMLAWEKQHAGFTYRTAISRHLVEDQRRRMYVQDRLEEDADDLMPMLNADRTLVYICGIAGMELGIFKTLARTLSTDQLAQYLTLDPAIASDLDSWERRMIPRAIKPTKRIFLEVY